MGELFSKEHLLKALKNAGLPSSYVSLMKYEKLGVVLLPKNMMNFGTKKYRFYTKDEIAESVKKVVEYKNANKKS